MVLFCKPNLVLVLFVCNFFRIVFPLERPEAGVVLLLVGLKLVLELYIALANLVFAALFLPVPLVLPPAKLLGLSHLFLGNRGAPLLLQLLVVLTGACHCDAIFTFYGFFTFADDLLVDLLRTWDLIER